MIYRALAQAHPADVLHDQRSSGAAAMMLYIVFVR
jgi:hypothetical protein